MSAQVRYRSAATNALTTTLPGRRLALPLARVALGAPHDFPRAARSICRCRGQPDQPRVLCVPPASAMGRVACGRSATARVRHCSGCFARSRLCADPPALRPRSGWAGMAGAPCCGGAGAMGGRGPDDSAEARHRAQVLAHAGRPWLWIGSEPFASACSHAFHFVHTGADGPDIIWLCVVGRSLPGFLSFANRRRTSL